MKLTQSDWLRFWTGIMLLVAVGLATYLTAYVWRRLDRPQVRDGGKQVVSNTTEDWAYYYAAADAMNHGQDIYSVEAPERGRSGYIYPPMLAFLYQPLAKLGLLGGARATLVIDMLAMAGALAVAGRALLERMALPTRWQAVLTVAVLAAILSSDKIKGELQMLQCNGLVALGMALGLWLLDRRPGWAGLALGFAINIKYQALGLVVYLVLRRRWKALGGTAAGTAFWALLPALSVGLYKDLEYLGRGASGVLRMMGVKITQETANVEPMSAGLSTSITSAAARVVEYFGMPMSPFVLAGTVAVLCLLGFAWMYRRRGVPVVGWPGEAGQKQAPWRLAVGAEWMLVIGLVLAFSPQTNSRHLVLTALMNVLGVVLVLASAGKTRWVAVAGLFVLWMGLNLPPGDRAAAPNFSAEHYWHWIGGPTWGILAGVALLTWCGLTLARRDTAERQPPAECPTPTACGR